MNPELKNVYNELEERALKHDLVQDNKSFFECNGKYFFVRMPSPKESHEADNARHKCFIELIQNKEELTKNKLKEILKITQNIDFDKLEIEKRKLQEEINDLYMSLATKRDGDKNILALKEKLQDLKSAQFDLTLSVSNYLSASIEEKVSKRYLEFITYLCAYRIDGTENHKIWTTFDEFLNDSSILPEKAVMFMTYLLFDMRSN